MLKNKKILAIIIVIAMLMSNMMFLFSNVSKAIQNNITVVFYADSDSSLKLENDNETLTYTHNSGRTYSFNLKQNDTNIKFTKKTEEPEPGHFMDKYEATNISSNNNVKITCAPEMSFDDICVRYDGDTIGFWNEEGKGYWASQTLNNLKNEGSDFNHYELRIETSYTHQDENNNEGNEPEPRDWANEVYSVDFGNATWEVKGKVVTATVEGKDITNGPVELKGDEVIKLQGYDERIMEPVLIRPDDFAERLRVTENGETWVINRNGNDYQNDLPFRFVVQRRTGSEEQEDDYHELPAGKIDVTINLSSDAEYANSFKKAIISINDYPINEEVEIGGDLPAENHAKYNDDAELNGKVRFSFSTLFIEKYVGDIVINGETFNVTENLLDYSNRTEWLNHYSHQMTTFEILVDKSENNVYNIKVNTAELEGKYQWIGNFLWTDREEEKYSRDEHGNIREDENGNPIINDEYIGNSLLEVIKVVYEIDGVEHTVEGNDLFHDRFVEYDPYREFASLTVPEGSTCTMKITPDYGYQVTSFGVNGGIVIAEEGLSEFTFPIHKGNFHLGAEVTQVDDKVDAKSEKVQSGNIEISKNEIDSGSVVLTVNDIVLDEGKRVKFEETAGDYTINSYLDIDLDKVLYKGTEDEVWSERIHELNNEAVVTLKLEEGIDGNNIIIVHNINDGDEYEIIEIESYDPETNTITFKTKSFSNYAIAVKKDATQGEEENNEEQKPQEKYTVEKGNYVVIFSDEEGHTYTLDIETVGNLSEEELSLIGMTKEEYEKAKAELIERLKEYGKVIEVYNITVLNEEDCARFGELTLKIKLTEEMKKYNSFKLVCIDNATIGKQDVVEFKIEGEYLVGNLYHLSSYALVVSNVTNDVAGSNPTTGDSIVITVAIFTIATLGLVTVIYLNKKSKVRKH